MIRSLWVAKTGMDVNQANLDVIAHNLANASTVSFKRVKPNFEDLLYQTVRAPGSQTSEQSVSPTGLQFGSGARILGTTRVLNQGALSQTSNGLDVAINGNGYFQINLPTGVAAAMVALVGQQRLFDLNVKMIQNADANARSANGIMSLSRG